MAYKDLHSEPFDEGTIAKLEIFEDYAQAWIPTFVMQSIPEICIFDFFAGTGFDKNGIAGSPIRILNKIKEQKGHLFQKRVKVKLFLNEFDKDKFEELKNSCNAFLSENRGLNSRIETNYYNEDFASLFPKLLPTIQKLPSLVYLDQNGIKFISNQYFNELEKCKTTDFLYFISSSYFWRFGESEEFQKHFNFNAEEAKKDPYKFIHRKIIEQLKASLPDKTKLKLYPFSIKKGANIHGIVFGASHPRAVDKFLDISWKRNEVNGEANFDIDDDGGKVQMDLFSGKKLTKIEGFQEKLASSVRNGELLSNKSILDFTYANGHIPKQSSEKLKQLKKEGVIEYEGKSPLITYNNVYKDKRIVQYQLKKK